MSSATKDKEGLVDFKFLNTVLEQRHFSGYLYGENFMLMAHPHFGRGPNQNANFAPRFIDLFWHFNKPEIDQYISIDFDRVRIDIEVSMYFEEDTWYGARFNKEISSVKDHIVKLRPSPDIDDFLISFCFVDAYSFDVKWGTKNGIKSFQAEEFKTANQTIEKDGVIFYPLRYVHAEFDLGENHFRNFDGVIHFYTAEEYFSKREDDFNYNSKNNVQIKTHSEKLFKMNGNVSVSDWIEFTSHFFTGNPLVIEYFEGKYPDHITEMLEAVRKSKEKNKEK